MSTEKDEYTALDRAVFKIIFVSTTLLGISVIVDFLSNTI